MTPQHVLLAVLVTSAMAAVDYAHAQYNAALSEARRARRINIPWRGCVHNAARWSVIQWGAAAIGFYVSVRVSMWFLPFEALGLYIGTWFGGTRDTPTEG